MRKVRASFSIRKERGVGLGLCVDLFVIRKAQNSKNQKHKWLKPTLIKTLKLLTFFKKMLAFTHMWARGYKLIDISHELGIGHMACVDWASYCREICLNAFIQHPRQLGGPGKTRD